MADLYSLQHQRPQSIQQAAQTNTRGPLQPPLGFETQLLFDSDATRNGPDPSLVQIGVTLLSYTSYTSRGSGPTGLGQARESKKRTQLKLQGGSGFQGGRPGVFQGHHNAHFCSGRKGPSENREALAVPLKVGVHAG